ncbi:MAG: hypothetical protein IJ163_01515 [Bacteroidaceae bacterium]|nr:hypothetical protein [Bacteroidaceae bacterium]
MNKKIIIPVLAVFTVLMFGVCFWSIYSDIHFENQVTEREDAVKARLKQIRDAEDNYRRVYRHYCGDIDSLIDFVKNEKSIKDTQPDRELTDDEYDQLGKEIASEGNYTEDEIKRMIPERAVKKGILHIDTIWEAVAEMIGISNADSLKLVPVGKEGATISLRKNDVFDLKTGEVTTLVEFRASLEDYLDGLEKKRVDNYKSDLVALGRQQQGLWANVDSVDHDKDEWIGLRMGDLFDASNKMAGNWNN